MVQLLFSTISDCLHKFLLSFGCKIYNMIVHYFRYNSLIPSLQAIPFSSALNLLAHSELLFLKCSEFKDPVNFVHWPTSPRSAEFQQNNISLSAVQTIKNNSDKQKWCLQTNNQIQFMLGRHVLLFVCRKMIYHFSAAQLFQVSKLCTLNGIPMAYSIMKTNCSWFICLTNIQCSD